MLTYRTTLLLFIAFFSITTTQAEIVITELMYNPASQEKIPADSEWLELYNTGDKTVSLAGWYLADEDGQTDPLPKSLEIEPQQAIILIPDDQTIEDFVEAWQFDGKVIPVSKWNNGGMKGLANNPTDTNEVLSLYSSSGEVVDKLNYDDNKPWPSDTKQGPSIYLSPKTISTAENDNGENWLRSKAGTNGAFNNKITHDYNKKDTGSPGFVQCETKPKQEPKQEQPQADDSPDADHDSNDDNVDDAEHFQGLA